MNPKFYLPAGKIQSDEDLEKQLGIVEDESWPVALIAIACALFVFLCFACVVAGLTFAYWKGLF